MEKLLKHSTILALIWAFLFTAYHYANLPDQVPIHFNAEGIVDNYGTKGMVWFLPILGTLMIFGLFKLRNKMLEAKVNEPGNQMKKVGLVLLILAFLVAVSFTYINTATLLIALGKAEGLGIWFLPVFIAAMIILPMIPIFGLIRPDQ